MSRQNFTTIKTSDPILDRVQDNIKVAFDPIVRHPLMEGVHKKGVAVGTASVEVNHGLGRKPQGFIVTLQDGSGVTYKSGETLFPEITIEITSTVNMNCDIFFF